MLAKRMKFGIFIEDNNCSFCSPSDRVAQQQDARQPGDTQRLRFEATPEGERQGNLLLKYFSNIFMCCKF